MLFENKDRSIPLPRGKRLGTGERVALDEAEQEFGPVSHAIREGRLVPVDDS